MSLLGPVELDCGVGTSLLGEVDVCVGAVPKCYFSAFIDTPEIHVYADVSPKLSYFDAFIDTPEFDGFVYVPPPMGYFSGFIDTPEFEGFVSVPPAGFFDAFIDTPEFTAFVDAFPDQTPVIVLTDSLELTDGTFTFHPFLTLTDRVSASGVTSASASVAVALTEEVTLRDLYSMLFTVAVEEQVEAEGAILPTIRALLTFAERLHVLPTITTRVHALQVVAEMVEVSARTGATLFLQLFEALDLEDATEFERVTVLLSLLEQVEAEDLIPNSIYLTLPPLQEQVGAESSLSLFARLAIALEEGAEVAGGLALGGEVYRALVAKESVAWVMNAETLGSWQYDNYPFTGFAECQGRFFGVKEDGVYLLDGDTDAGMDINAVITTGLSDLGTKSLKSLTRAYLLLSNSGEMALQVFSTDGAKKTTNHYLLDPTAYQAPENKRVKLQRGVKAAMFGAELRNIDGSDFALHGWEVYAVKLRRKI